MNIPKEKKCFICGRVKPIDDFYKHKGMDDGHLNKCKECTRKYMADRQKQGLTKATDWKRHHLNPDRYRKHIYYGIKYRCTHTKRSDGSVNSYYGREFISLAEWDLWCKQTEKTFLSLWKVWKDSNFDRRYTPSIDRIDDSKGYVLGNIQWLTLHNNIEKFAQTVRKQILMTDLNGKVIKVYNNKDEIIADGFNFKSVKSCCYRCDKNKKGFSVYENYIWRYI